MRSSSGRGPGERPVTIYDVARLAGVSSATVSRYVNKTTTVRPATAQRIQAAIDETGFTLNQVASSLTTRRTGLIGFITSDLLNPFTAEVAHAMSEEASAGGFSLLTAVTSGHEDRFLRMLSELRQHQVDAVIATPPEGAATVSALQDLLGSGIAVTTIGIDLGDPSAGFVSVDTHQGALEAVRHLLSLGHRRIGYLAGPDPNHTGRGRYQGYRDALETEGIRLRSTLVVRSSADREGGAEGMRRLLRVRNPPTAVFALNDVMALGALQAGHALRIRVPDDISVVGFDDIAMASHAAPPLTTVAQPKTDLGRRAARSVMAQLSGAGAPAPARLLCELVVRDSTRPPFA